MIRLEAHIFYIEHIYGYIQDVGPQHQSQAVYDRQYAAPHSYVVYPESLTQGDPLHDRPYKDVRLSVIQKQHQHSCIIAEGCAEGQPVQTCIQPYRANIVSKYV